MKKLDEDYEREYDKYLRSIGVFREGKSAYHVGHERPLAKNWKAPYEKK
jgi:hypothetical protein